MKKQSIMLDDGEISFLTDGNGPPLLLLHSLGVSSESWSKVIEPMAQSYSVYAIDMMGHGDSDKPPRNFLIEDHARSIMNFCDKFNLSQIILCGNSVGALVALETAAAYPGRINALVLVGCPVWDAWERMDRITISALNYDVQGNPLPATREQLAMSYTHITPELIMWVNQQRDKAGQWMKKTSIAIGLYDALPKLPLIKCPSLAVFGISDLLLACKDSLLKGIKDLKLTVIPDAGHLPQLDNPGDFVHEVKQFLGNVNS